MKHVFYPKSVAVVGVSAKPDNLGRNIMLNLIDFGYEGVVYPDGHLSPWLQCAVEGIGDLILRLHTEREYRVAPY